MKIQCERKNLADAFQIVGGLIPPRSVKPVLQHAKLLADGSGLELWATDLELSLRYRIPDVTVDQEGMVVIPAGRMSAILREVDDGIVTLDADHQICNLNCAKSFFKLLGWDPEEFPEIPPFQDRDTIEISSETLKALIRNTGFAAAKEKTRYALNGVLLRIRESIVEMVATDGRRLARQVVPIDNPKGVEKKALLPTKGLTQLEKLIMPEDEVVQLDFEENMVRIKTRNAELSIRQIEGAFPDFEEVIPKEHETRIISKPSAFCSALRKASIMTSDETRAVRIRFSGGEAELTTHAADVGESKVQLAVEVEGKDQDVNFNPDFLLEGLRVLPDDEGFHLDLTNPSSPGKVTYGEGYTYVVMPINLDA